MDNKIVSTTYVPLQPPYQIIKYTGDIAMQIGTLIVTIQKDGNVNGLGYEIETHSHPVVTYENKYKTDPNHQLSSYNFLEGAVWNYVEVKDVTTICLTNSLLPWHEFIEFLWRDVNRRLCVAQPTIGAYWSLDKLCGGVEPPNFQQYVIHMERYNHDKIQGQNIPAVRSRIGDVLALNAQAINDDEMLETIVHQLSNYIMILRNHQHPTTDLKFVFETEDEELRNLVNRLNASRVLTEPLSPFLDDVIKLVNEMKKKK